MAKAPAKKAARTTARKKTTTGTSRRTPAKKAAPRRAPATRAAVTRNAPKAAARTDKKVEKKPATPRLPSDVKLALKLAQDKQAIDVTVLDLRSASAFTDFFIICTGNNTKQVQAIADAIEMGLKADGQSAALVEGYSRGEWILLDYFTFIVHVFLPGQRNFYALERLWGGAETIEVSER